MYRQRDVSFCGLQLLQLFDHVAPIQRCTEELAFEEHSATRGVHLIEQVVPRLSLAAHVMLFS